MIIIVYKLTYYTLCIYFSQLLDLFSLEIDKKKTKETADEDVSSLQVPGISGVKRSVFEMFPELWDQQQYEDEYNLDSFIATLKNTF